MQNAHVIDLSRSYIPIDPESFYENMGFTGQEDSPERLLQIVPFEGYNFLPTIYGYKSYFNTDTKLDITAFSEKVQHLLLFQTSSLKSHLIALAETGAYFTDPQTQGSSWTRLYTTGTSTDLWSFCVLENDLYLYRQGASTICKVPYNGTIAAPGLTNITPSFLNMAAQMGIFRANGRMGMWDSANTISWSSLFDYTDFTPSISTLAANVLFNDILGKIITVRSFGDGFIIYSTKNIVGAEFDTGGSILFRAKNLAEAAGIWDPRQVCGGASDIEQYAYTNSGIKHITGNMQVENVFVSVFDFLKECRDPVFVNFINGRFLFLSTPNPDFLYGKVTYNLQTVSSYTIRFLENGIILSSTLPTTVDGRNLADDIVDQIQVEKEDEGLYSRWTASGSTMLSGRTPTSMNPYVLDDPFIPGDENDYLGNTTPLMTQAQLEAIRDSINPTFVSPHSVNDSTPFSKDLGWTRNNKGVADTALTRFKTRQNKEWDEYTILAGNLYLAVNAIAVTSTSTLYSTKFYYLLQNAINDTPSPISATYTKIGEFPISGPDPVETFTNSNTYNATWKYEKTFNAGAEVQFSNNARTYDYKIYLTATCYDQLGTYDAYADLGPNYPGNTNPPGGTVYTVNNDSGFNIDLNMPYTIVDPYDISTINSALATLAPIANSYFINNYYSTIFIFPSTLDFADYNGNNLETNCPLIRVDTLYNDGFITYVGIYKVGTWELRGYSISCGYNERWGIHEISYKSIKAIPTSISPTIKSTAVGDQDCLDWCNYLIYNPNPIFPYATGALTIPLSIPATPSTLPPFASYTYPGATFLLQNGALGPAYPTMLGSLVYDTHLQKWGKQKNTFYALLDYTPVNSTVEKTISFTNVGMDAGLITTNGKVKLFATNCTDSFIRYGKIGFNRQGFSNIEEICCVFKEPFTGDIKVECSIDGRNLQASLLQQESFSGEGYCRVYPQYAGRWYTISVTGTFDIRSMYVTGSNAGWR